jgi:hypothetical protein
MRSSSSLPPRHVLGYVLLIIFACVATTLVAQAIVQARRSARVSLTASDLTAAGAHLISRAASAPRKGTFAHATGHTAQTLQNLAAGSKTLRFAVCNGFANQRLSIVYGILIAAKTRRVPVLPSLIADGRQFVDLGPGAEAQGGVGFDSYYDEPFFLRSMMDLVSMRVLPDSAAPPASAYKRVSIAELGPDLLEGLRAYDSTNHVAIDCPLFALPPGAIEAEGEHIWGVLDALRPAPVIQVRMAVRRCWLARFPFLHSSHSLFTLSFCILHSASASRPWWT